MKLISFFVAGDPKPQPRSRSFVLRGRGGKPIMKNGQPIIRVNDPGTAEGWKNQIAVRAKEFVPFELPLFKASDQSSIFVSMVFVFKRPQAHFRSNGVQLKEWAPTMNTSRIDCDNLAKAVLDCLTTLGFWDDDGIVAVLRVVKRYCRPGENSGCQIEICETLEDSSMKLPITQQALKL